MDVHESGARTRTASIGGRDSRPPVRGDLLSAKSLAESRRAPGTSPGRSASGHSSDDRDATPHSILSRLLRAEHRRGGGSSSDDGRKGAPTGLLSSEELATIERDHPDGITAAQIVSILSDRGLRFSEATFRKYVQKGLLPRSRRVGRKGKHRGSLGLYPAKSVRRVNAIKRLMTEGYTIEEIQDRFLRYTDLIEALEEHVVDVFARFDADISEPRFDKKTHKSLAKDIAEAKKFAADLLRRVGGISQRLSGPREEDLGPAGAAGSAEDLL